MVDLHLLHFQVFLVFSLLFLFFIQIIYHLQHHHHQHHQFRLCNNSINFDWITLTNRFSNRLYIGITISKSSALCINALLTFEMHDLNEALFYNATSFSTLSFSFAAAANRSLVPFTTIYASLWSKYDRSIKVLKLIFFLTEYWSLDKSFTSTLFFCHKCGRSWIV